MMSQRCVVRKWLHEGDLTVSTVTSSETSDGGRLTRQFFKWTRDISAAVAFR